MNADSDSESEDDERADDIEEGTNRVSDDDSVSFPFEDLVPFERPFPKKNDGPDFYDSD